MKKKYLAHDTLEMRNFAEYSKRTSSIFLKSEQELIPGKNKRNTDELKIVNNIKSVETAWKILSKKKVQNLKQGLPYNNLFKIILYYLHNFSIFYLYFISSVTGFLPKFFQNANNYNKTVIIALKLTSLVINIVYLIFKLTAIINSKSKRIYGLKEIIEYRLSQVNFYAHVLLIIVNILLLALPGQRIVGIVLFCIVCFCLKLIFDNISEVGELLALSKKNIRLTCRLTNNLFFSISVAHFVASIFLVISYFQSYNNWMNKTQKEGKPISEAEWYQIYIWSYYWATTVMTTVGFGDVFAANHLEALIVSIIEVTSVMVLAYTISNVGAILSQLQVSSQQIKKKIGLLKRVGNQMNIDLQLLKRMQFYIQNQSSKTYEQEYFNQQKELTDQLPDKLRLQYMQQVHKTVFKNVRMLSFVSQGTKSDLIANLRLQIYFTGFQIISNTDRLNQIVLLKKGCVGLVCNRGNYKTMASIVQKIKIEKGCNPQLITWSFFNPSEHLNYNVISWENTECFHLTYQDILNSLKKNNYNREYFFSLLHKHSIINNSQINQQCPYCTSHNTNLFQNTAFIQHTIFQCPSLHYMPTKSIIIAKAFHTRPVKRKSQFKRYKAMFSPLKARKQQFATYQEQIKRQPKITKIINSKRQLSLSRYNNYSENLTSTNLNVNRQNSLNDQTNICESDQISSYLQRKLQDHCNPITSMFNVDQIKNYLFYFQKFNANKIMKLTSLRIQ